MHEIHWYSSLTPTIYVRHKRNTKSKYIKPNFIEDIAM